MCKPFPFAASARVTAMVGFAAILAASAGCGDKGKKKSKADQKGSSSQDKSGLVIGKAGDSKGPATGTPAAKPIPDERKPPTREEYEQLFLATAKCQIKNGTIDTKCPEKLAFYDARTRLVGQRDLIGVGADMGKKYIGHENPVIRMQAAGFLSSIFASDPASQELIVKAARAEKEPAVLAAMIQAFGSKGARNPTIGKLLLELADHPEPEVRKKAVVWLGSSWNAELPGSVDKLIEKIQKDENGEVRRFACRYSGSRGDDRLVAVYEKLTAKPDKDVNLYTACMEGLMNSWMHYPLFATHNQKAYRLTLKRLAYKPRNQSVPPWNLMDNFAELAKEKNEKVVAWKENAPWFKPAEVLDVLEPIVLDKNAFRLARAGSLKSMVALGVDKARLQKIRAQMGEPQAVGDKVIAKQLDEAISPKPGPPGPGAKPAGQKAPSRKLPGPGAAKSPGAGAVQTPAAGSKPAAGTP